MTKVEKEAILKATSEKEAPEVNVSSPFFLSFFGQRVKIMANIYKQYGVQTREGIAQESLPISLTGYILDADEQYYYIGGTPHEIKTAIKKDLVILLESYSEEDEQAEAYEHILDNLPPPKNNNEQN
jgi:hypothetical protein